MEKQDRQINYSYLILLTRMPIACVRGCMSLYIYILNVKNKKDGGHTRAHTAKSLTVNGSV